MQTIGSLVRAVLAIILVLVLIGVPIALARTMYDTESTFFSTAAVEEHASVVSASDGDLWPSCWGADNHLYAANGDGRGFSDEPWADIVMNRIFGTPLHGSQCTSPSSRS